MSEHVTRLVLIVCSFKFNNASPKNELKRFGEAALEGVFSGIPDSKMMVCFPPHHGWKSVKESLENYRLHEPNEGEPEKFKLGLVLPSKTPNPKKRRQKLHIGSPSAFTSPSKGALKMTTDAPLQEQVHACLDDIADLVNEFALEVLFCTDGFPNFQNRLAGTATELLDSFTRARFDFGAKFYIFSPKPQTSSVEEWGDILDCQPQELSASEVEKFLSPGVMWRGSLLFESTTNFEQRSASLTAGGRDPTPEGGLARDGEDWVSGITLKWASHWSEDAELRAWLWSYNYGVAFRRGTVPRSSLLTHYIGEMEYDVEWPAGTEKRRRVMAKKNLCYIFQLRRSEQPYPTARGLLDQVNWETRQFAGLDDEDFEMQQLSYSGQGKWGPPTLEQRVTSQVGPTFILYAEETGFKAKVVLNRKELLQVYKILSTLGSYSSRLESPEAGENSSDKNNVSPLKDISRSLESIDPGQLGDLTRSLAKSVVYQMDALSDEAELKQLAFDELKPVPAKNSRLETNGKFLASESLRSLFNTLHLSQREVESFVKASQAHGAVADQYEGKLREQKAQHLSKLLSKKKRKRGTDKRSAMKAKLRPSTAKAKRVPSAKKMEQSFNQSFNGTLSKIELATPQDHTGNKKFMRARKNAGKSTSKPPLPTNPTASRRHMTRIDERGKTGEKTPFEANCAVVWRLLGSKMRSEAAGGKINGAERTNLYKQMRMTLSNKKPDFKNKRMEQEVLSKMVTKLYFIFSDVDI